MKSDGCGCSSMAEQKLPKLGTSADFRHPILKTATLSPDRPRANLKTDVRETFASIIPGIKHRTNTGEAK